jgi:serine phosphatase RsbU (regulator of sigma subunit)
VETSPILSSRSHLLQRNLQSLTVELLSAYEELSLLYSLGSEIGRLTHEKDIAALSIKEAIEISAADCGWLVRTDGMNFQIAEGCRHAISFATAQEISGRILNVFHRGKNEFLSHSLRVDEGFCQKDAPARFLACGLRTDSNFYGFLCLGRKEERSIFLSPDQKLIRAVAVIAGVQIENSRLHRSELEKQRLVNELERARFIQESLSPYALPGIPFAEAAASTQPCYSIGGDFYNLIPIGNASCMIIMADICGKGPAAALQAAMVQGAVSGILQTNPDLRLFVQRLNDCVLQESAGKFLTAFTAIVHESGSFQYVNAGHPAALWIKANSKIETLNESTSMLGFFSKMEFSTAEVQLSPGDIIVLYTDGITDAENESGDCFGVQRLMDCVANQYGSSCEEIKNGILKAIQSFCGRLNREDDSSILVMKFLGSKCAGADS